MMRLKADQTRETAVGALRGVQPQVREATLPGGPPARLAEYLREPFDLTPAATGRSTLRDRYGRSLLMLMAVVIGVLFIACVNIASLLLARADSRRVEMSVRMALGASRAQIARLLLAEGACLSIAGGLIGVGFSRWFSDLLVRQLSTRNTQVFLDLSPDWRVLGFASAITFATAVLFGAVPAWRSSGADPGDALKEQGRGPAGSGRSPAAATLVVVQVALSLVLVVAAGLFIRTFSGLAVRPVGFAKDRVLLVNVTAPTTKYTLTQLKRVYERINEAVAAVPGVERAALSDITPAGGSARQTFVDVSDGTPRSGQERMTSVNVISPGWLSTYGMRLLAGRDFVSTDRLNAPPVALVNEAFVRHFLAGGNPIGHTIDTGGAKVEIVGLVEDVVYESLRQAVPPTMFTATTQRSAARPYVNVSVLAAHGAPATLSPSISTAILGVAPEMVLQSRTLTEQVNADMSQERMLAVLFGSFGGLALLLAALGLYGVMANAVSRRRAEIGIRMALGARPSRVVQLVMRRAVAMVAAGVALGTVLSLWASRFVETLVWGLEPRDPATLVSAAAILAAVGAFAGWLPAWRASRIDPAIVLRE
jgi:predicted permease